MDIKIEVGMGNWCLIPCNQLELTTFSYIRQAKTFRW